MIGAMLAEAWSALAANRLRSILTMLGMVIGVGAVITMLSVGGGAKAMVEAQIQSMGSNLLIVQAGSAQVGAVASFPIAERWSIVGAYYFDTNVNKEADSMLGLQYNSCCYAIRFGYERKLNGWDNTQKHAIYDNTIGFNIELRGLSSNYGLGTNQMLRSNILPYQSSL